MEPVAVRDSTSNALKLQYTPVGNRFERAGLCSPGYGVRSAWGQLEALPVRLPPPNPPALPRTVGRSTACRRGTFGSWAGQQKTAFQEDRAQCCASDPSN